MTGKILVTPQKLTSTAQAFSTSNNNVRNLTNQMLQRVKQMNSQWTGDSANTYQQKFAALEADMNKIYQMIDEHVRDLQEMAANYEKAETETNQNANGLKPALQ